MRELRQILTSVLFILAVLVPLDYLLGVVLDREPLPLLERSVALREWAPGQSRVLVPPDRDLQRFPHMSAAGYQLTTDHNGFILGPQGSPGSSDIVFIGASTTECLYVDEDKRFPYLVGERLRRPDGSAVGTLNGASTGSHGIHTLVALIAKTLPLRPDMVVVMLNGNDLTTLEQTGDYWLVPPSRAVVELKPVATTGFEPAAERIRRGLRAVMDMLYPNFSREGRAFLRSRGNVLQDEWQDFRSQTRPRQATFASLEADYRAMLTSIITVAQAWGIEVVLMTEFNRIRLDDKRARAQFEVWSEPEMYPLYVAHYARFNEVVRELATEHDLTLIDLDQLVPPEEKYIYDSLHLTTEGSVLVAEILATELARRYDELQLR